MAIIRTKMDWVKSAAETLPRLPDYATDMGREWQAAKAQEHFNNGEYLKLWGMLNDFWYRLPDAGLIRVGPFFDLCDLCSEGWVLQE